MSDKFRIEMSKEDLLSTLFALKNSNLVDPVSPILDLLTQVKDDLLVTVDIEKGFIFFGLYDGYFYLLAESN